LVYKGNIPFGVRERPSTEVGSIEWMMMKNGDEDAPHPGSAPRQRAGDSGLRARQKVIGMGLKRLYDNVVEEPVPDDFADLLRRLDEASGGGEVR